MAKGFVSSLTVASLCASCATIATLVGSASAAKVRARASVVVSTTSVLHNPAVVNPLVLLDASQALYERYLGLVPSQTRRPHAVVFETTPFTFADLTVTRSPFTTALE